QKTAYQDIEKAARHARKAELNAQSKEEALQLTDSFGKAFDIYSKRLGPEAAMDKTVRNVYRKMREMRPAGAKILGDNSLAGAEEQAKQNPKAAGNVDWLTKHIKAKFSELGQHVQIVNGTILTGSQREWKNIADAITTPAEQARQEASDSFTQLQQK